VTAKVGVSVIPAAIQFGLLAFCVLILVDAPRTESQILPADIKSTVGFIFGKAHVKDQSGVTHEIEMPLGTGFFIGWLDKRGGADWGYTYFVTAKHVLRDADNRFLKKVKIRLNLLTQQGERNFDYIEIPVTDDLENLVWFQDPDDLSDEAIAFPIAPDRKRFNYKVIPNDWIVTDQLLKEQQVAEGDSVVFIGLMAQFYGAKQNFPVVRKGSIALLTDELLPTPNGPQHGYVCEVASWPGNSGSPVFLYLGGLRRNTLSNVGFRLLGIVISYYNNSHTGETTETATVSFNDPTNIGLAFVLPAAQITKILSAPFVQQLRDKFTDEHNKEKR